MADSDLSNIFSDGRRKILAKTFMDFSKVFLAGAFTSEFLEGPTILRVTLVLMVIGFLIGGFLVFPPKEGDL